MPAKGGEICERHKNFWWKKKCVATVRISPDASSELEILMYTGTSGHSLNAKIEEDAYASGGEKK